MHAGLREILGKHVKQAGSLVAPNHLRFDFSHFTGVADEELQDIEDIINKEVLHNEKVEVIENVPIDVAVNEYHAMALFGEKYGEEVRVVTVPDFSTELCGGVHVHHLVVGIVLALVAGMLDIAVQPGSGARELLAVVFGAGAALILDEFALSVHLHDVYWTPQGRRWLTMLMPIGMVLAMVFMDPSLRTRTNETELAGQAGLSPRFACQRRRTSFAVVAGTIPVRIKSRRE